MSYGVTLPLLPELLAGAGIVEPAAVARHTGWLTSLYTVALIAVAPAWGRAADRGHGRALAAAALLLTAATVAMLPFAASLTALYAARAAAGLASAGVLPIVLSAVAIGSEAEDRPMRFGWISSATALGFLLGPLSGEFATRAAGISFSTYRLAPLAAAAFAAACALAVSVVHLPVNREQRGRESPMYAGRKLVLPWIATAAAALVVTVIEVGITLLAREALWPASRSVAVYFVICSVVMVLVQLGVYPRAQKTWGALRIEEIALFTMALGVGSLAKPSSWIPVASFVLVAFGIGVMIPSMAVRIAAVAPTGHAGRALALQASFANLGQAVGAAATGWLYTLDIAAPFMVTSIAVIVFAIAYGNMCVAEAHI